jgi:hypothetical protein
VALATADFSTAAANCAAFGRNDGVWVRGERTGNCNGKVQRQRQRQRQVQLQLQRQVQLQLQLQLQQQISPLRRQTAPPSVEMTGLGEGKRTNKKRDYLGR